MLRSLIGRKLPCLPAVASTFKSFPAANLTTETTSSSVDGTTMTAHPFGDKDVFDQREIWPWVEKITSEVGERVGKAAMLSFDSMMTKI
jgi:hypothetical protein